jgi:hypothetical protein
VIDGAAVVDHPDLEDRVLVLDLAAAARMEERPTPRDTGVDPAVQSFDEAAARQLLIDQPQIVDPSMDEDENIRRIQERVRLDVRIAWQVLAESRDAVRAIAVPADLRRD